MGWGVLNEPSAGAGSRNKEEETGRSGEPDTSHLEESVFYPFTFPITSGPGALVALLTVTAHISDKNLTRDILAHLGVFLAIVALSILCYFCYAYAPYSPGNLALHGSRNPAHYRLHPALHWRPDRLERPLRPPRHRHQTLTSRSRSRSAAIFRCAAEVNSTHRTSSPPPPVELPSLSAPRLRVSWRWVDSFASERIQKNHADIRRHRHRFQLLQTQDRPRARAPAQNTRRRPRSHPPRRQRL